MSSDTTETTDTTENGAETAADATNDTTEPKDTGDTESGSEPLTNEAKKYRLRLRETESQLSAATERIAALQRAEAERIAGGLLAEPGDLFTLSGSELADVLDAEGNVDADAVTALAKSITESRPGLRKPSRAVDPSQGRSSDLKSEATWGDLFK